MAVARLADVVVPTVFFPYMQKDTTTKSAIFNSGIFRTDPMLSTALAGGGRTFNVPFWKDLADTESDVGSDDVDSDAIPDAITTGTDIAVRNVRTKGWASTRLVAELAGSDPLRRITERVGAYWRRQFQTILVSMLRGVFADNIANDSGDMVYDIGTDAALPVTAAERVSAEAIIEAAQTMGDNKDGLAALIMHSRVHANLQKLNLIDFIPDSEGRIAFQSYLGYRIVIDDGVPAIAGSNRTEYWTFLMGTDSVAWNEAPLPNAVSLDNDESRADGMGVDELWTRRQFAMHPYGIKWTDTVVAGEFPSNAELRNASNWDRVYPERKQVNMALLITNG